MHARCIDCMQEIGLRGASTVLQELQAIGISLLRCMLTKDSMKGITFSRGM